MPIKRDVAGLVLYDSQGRILLQHRDDTAPSSPGHWGFFGGGMEDGETPLEAMLREIMEELEYVPRNPVPLISFPYESHSEAGEVKTGTWNSFIDCYDISQPLVQHEGQGMAWVLPEDTADLLMTDRVRKVIRVFVEYWSNRIVVS